MVGLDLEKYTHCCSTTVHVAYQMKVVEGLKNMVRAEDQLQVAFEVVMMRQLLVVAGLHALLTCHY